MVQMSRTKSVRTLLRLDALEARDVPSFLPPVSYAPGGGLLAGVTLANLNADGHRDVAAVIHNNVSVLFGDGNGTLGAPTKYPIGSDAVSVRAADLNLDARPDLVVGYQNGNTVSVLLNNGDGTFGSATDIP